MNKEVPVDRATRRGVWAMLVGVGLLMGGGCSGTGEVFYLDVSPASSTGTGAKAEPVKIVIEPFDDLRSDKRVGTRTHLGGGVSYFDVAGGKPGEVVAQALARRLRERGWQEKAWDVTMAPASGKAAGVADIIVTGQVMEFSAQAKGRFFNTKLTVGNKLVLQAKNAGDRSMVTRTVESSRSNIVFWYDTSDVQELLTTTLQDSLDRLVADTKIENRSLRPVR
jgi:hypothetical protein